MLARKMMRDVAWPRMLVWFLTAAAVGCAAGRAGSAGSPSRLEALEPPPTEASREQRLARLDAYLQSWDAFARGDQSAAGVVVSASEREWFEQDLTELLRNGDRAAPARLVFYQVVQIFTSLEVDTPLGTAAQALLGPPGEAGFVRSFYLPVDLYRWWTQHAAHFEPLPLLQRWERSEEHRELIAGWLKPHVPAPAGAQPITSFMDLPLAQDPETKSDVPAQTPAPAETLAAANLRGSLSKEAIRTVITSHLQEVRSCYESALDTRPSLQGRVAVKFIIAPLGVVAKAAVKESDLGEPLLEHCILRSVLTWLFPRPEGGGIVVVTYPFTLEVVTSAEQPE